MKSYGEMLDTMASIGAALPHFKAYIELFANNVALQRLLELFFRDILDFHLAALNFVKFKR